MLNLYNYLTPLDNKRIENYINLYGVEDGYKGNDEYLCNWKNSKKKLFHLLGGKLIFKQPYTYKKPQEAIKSQISTLRAEYKDFFKELEELLLTEEYDHEGIGDIRNLRYCFSRHVLCENTVYDNIKYKREGLKGTLQIQKGMKPIRAIQKIIQFFNFSHLKNDFEKFRVSHSMIFNEKEINGTLCLSIHPMDYITMSDNASDWSSCMSWMEKGCYRIGTVEMMNSNNVICAYIEGHTPLNFNKNEKGEEWQWNNKKWRQLFYFTKDIIVGGKAYPYHNDDFTLFALNLLRQLAKDNLKWEYSFGPEPYKDMIHVGNLHRMDKNKEWIRKNQTFKHNIIFDTKGMYNDMLNAQDYPYLCVRNKVKKTKVISYSGQAQCLCCSKPVIRENDDFWYDQDGSYNERYTNLSSVICTDCRDKRECSICGGSKYYSTYHLGSRQVCSSCWDSLVKTCPDCGTPFLVSRIQDDRTQFIIKLKDEILSLQDMDSFYRLNNSYFKVGHVCEKCLSKKKDRNEVKKTLVEVDRNKLYYEWHTTDKFFFTNKVYTNPDEYDKYLYENLTPAPKDIKLKI